MHSINFTKEKQEYKFTWRNSRNFSITSLTTFTTIKNFRILQKKIEETNGVNEIFARKMKETNCSKLELPRLQEETLLKLFVPIATAVSFPIIKFIYLRLR